MNWSRKHTLAAGAGLILAVNVVALSGVAYNRSGEPDSLLRLTERELHKPYDGWGFARENSGLALKIQWRIRTRDAAEGEPRGYLEYYGEPAWLDKAKLAELGVDVSQPLDTPRGKRHYGKLTAVEAFLVLEQDGETYRATLEAARSWAARQKAEAASRAGDKTAQSRAETAARQLETEERVASRLFVIDAGRDEQALRAKYPDRARYAVVRGRIEPTLVGRDKSLRLAGRIEGLSNEQVNVPVHLRAVFEGLSATDPYDTAFKGRFEAAVAHGQRLEPWLVAAARKAP
jgi:hypothetical protein